MVDRRPEGRLPEKSESRGDAGAGRAGLIAPVALLMLVSTLALCLLVYFSAEKLDQQADATARHLANTLIAAKDSEVAMLAYDYSWWDIAIERLVETTDETWADENIGSYLHESYGIAASFVLAADDRPIIGFVDGELSERESLEVLGPGISQLIERARAAPMEEPLAASGLVANAKGLQIVAVSALTRENPTHKDLAARARPVLILAFTLDEAFFDEQAPAFALEGLRLVMEALPEGHAGIPLLGVGGERLGWLAWQRQRPGWAMLGGLWPALAGILLTLALLLYLFFRRADLVLARQAALGAALRRERDARRLKSQFVSMVSHQLRTPLTTIAYAAEMLGRYSDRMSEQERRHELEEIGRAVGRLNRMIDNVMVLGKAEVAEDLGELQPIELPALCREVWQEVASGLKAGHRLELEEPQDPLWFTGNEVYLRAILGNLFENAIKFSPEADRVTVELTRGDTETLIRVVDYGIGVPSDEFEAIFEPFHRAANASHAAGTGLGLAVVNALLSKLGGRIRLRSESGRGSTFELGLSETEKAA